MNWPFTRPYQYLIVPHSSKNFNGRDDHRRDGWSNRTVALGPFFLRDLFIGENWMYGARVLYEQPPITSPFEPGTGKGMLRPEDVTSHDLPVGMRGYDREHVERFLHRVSEAYLLTWRQALALRERLRLLEEELAEAHGEAEVSSKAVSELVQRCSTAEDHLTQARSAHAELVAKAELAESERKKAVDSHAELAAKVELAESEREKAVAEVRELTERAAEMEKRLETSAAASSGSTVLELPSDADAETEAANLLVAAARAAEDVRVGSRRRAVRTLVKARERAALIQSEADREQEALAAAQEALAAAQHASDLAQQELAVAHERREKAEAEAEEILARAQAQADRVVTSVEDERARMRELLSGALASLEAEVSTHVDDAGITASEDLVSDLATRLQEPTAAEDS